MDNSWSLTNDCLRGPLKFEWAGWEEQELLESSSETPSSSFGILESLLVSRRQRLDVPVHFFSIGYDVRLIPCAPKQKIAPCQTDQREWNKIWLLCSQSHATEKFYRITRSMMTPIDWFRTTPYVTTNYQCATAAIWTMSPTYSKYFQTLRIISMIAAVMRYSYPVPGIDRVELLK